VPSQYNVSASTGTAKSVLTDADESFEVRTDRTALRRYIRRMRAISVGACPIPRHPPRMRQAGGGPPAREAEPVAVMLNPSSAHHPGITSTGRSRVGRKPSSAASSVSATRGWAAEMAEQDHARRLGQARTAYLAAARRLDHTMRRFDDSGTAMDPGPGAEPIPWTREQVQIIRSVIAAFREVVQCRERWDTLRRDLRPYEAPR
jgi:hypothetical protein